MMMLRCINSKFDENKMINPKFKKGFKIDGASFRA